MDVDDIAPTNLKRKSQAMDSESESNEQESPEMVQLRRSQRAKTMSGPSEKAKLLNSSFIHACNVPITVLTPNWVALNQCPSNKVPVQKM